MNGKAGLAVLTILAAMIRTTFAEDTQKRAEAMMQRARELSDIRSQNAPSFRLKATFSFIDEDLETVQGSFTEVWISNAQWRRETTTKDFQRIEIGGPNRLWRLDSGKKFPAYAARISSVLEIFPARLANFEFDSIKDRSADDPSTECAVTKAAAPQQQRSAFCFDKEKGMLVEKIFPEEVRSRVLDYACQYGAFRSFGHYSVPREMDCFLERHRKMEAQVTELSAADSPDPGAFVAPTGSLELGNCSVKSEPPRPVSTPDPGFPSHLRGRNSTVVVQLIVDVKGKAQDVQIARSGGESFDDEAVRAVRNWKFKPASCNGEAMAIQLTVEINFSLSR
jgi:TonB family protein